MQLVIRPIQRETDTYVSFPVLTYNAVQKYILNGVRISLPISFTILLEETLERTVKTAIQITLIINQYDDLSLSKGGGSDASLFFHAKISRVITKNMVLEQSNREKTTGPLMTRLSLMAYIQEHGVCAISRKKMHDGILKGIYWSYI